MDITTVPQTPDYMKGVINLRGKVRPEVEVFNAGRGSHSGNVCNSRRG